MANEDNRNTPAVSGRKRVSSKKMIAIGIVVAVIIAACILLPMLLSGQGKDKEPEPEKKNETLVKKESNDVSIAAFQRQVAQEETARKKRQAEEEAEAARKKAEEERKRKKMEESQKRLDEMNKKLYGNNPPPPQNAPSAVSSGSGNQKEMTPEQRKLTGHVLFDYNYESHADSNTAGNQGTMNTMLSGEQYADSAAGIIRFNPDYLLSGGTVLPCILRTHIITSYPGIVLCQLTKDIYSQNGKTLLLRSGSTFFGEQKQVMLNGQARIFLNWNSVDTPEHVRVRIDALGTDPLGASGTPAWVDSHIWERLRESIMLSLFRDSLDILKNKTSEHNNDVVYDNTSNNVEDIATQAFKRSADIAATGYVAQGTLMNILVPRDLDFSTVFANH
ncbi:TrbI/VirB10 family protein [Klebsiella oxytoca]|uniref:TrbI/VirB10 family protein n=1 Tax=Klebsiella oxytoca TaxID=571 RepID=UPI00254E349E|nr:TrbI/VirB10 family protein [Klebsiella oxytoca]MEC5509928.1 TrbI/VirB10 family protein [Klebsiella oxytoca]